ncbi:MAG TPA: asparagine synthase-related protein [Alphaproteobacteria bacterium]
MRSIGDGPCSALLRSGRPDIQSFQDQDGSFVLIDGEIFDISGETARARNTAAAVLALYRRHGIEGFARLNSNAAVAVWDAPAQRLIFARDRTGLGLCYWMERNGAVLFSSDLVSLLRRDERTELNPEAIDLFLASGFISSPWTSLRHIHKVPLGHCLIVDAEGTRLKRYWRQSGKPRLRLSKQETIERLAELVNQAVARQHSGGARSGLLLSSGVDSTLLAALLARHGIKPDTFTFRYTHYEGRYNESPGALRAAQHCGLPHTEMLVGPEDVSGALEEVLLRHQGPMTYGLHTAILKDIAESGAQILYSGQGNGSLCPSATERFALALGHLPFPHRTVARLLRKRIDGGRSQRLLRVGLIAATGLNWRFHAPLTDDAARAELYLEPERTEHAVAAQHELFQSVIAQYDGESDIDRMSGALQSLYTADGTLHWTAAFSRSYGLLPRCPYFDSDLIDFLYRLPRQTGKAEIRSYASQLLPPDLAYAKKLGQTIPISLWFRGPLAPWLRQQLDRDRIVAAGLFHPARVQALVDQHVSGAADRGWTLWIILVLTAWQEIVRREAGRLLSAETMISRTG